MCVHIVIIIVTFNISQVQRLLERKASQGKSWSIEAVKGILEYAIHIYSGIAVGFVVMICAVETFL